MVNESFGNLYLKVVDLQQNLSSFRPIIRTRRALELMHYAIRHAIQSISAGYNTHNTTYSSNNATHLSFSFQFCTITHIHTCTVLIAIFQLYPHSTQTHTFQARVFHLNMKEIITHHSQHHLLSFPLSSSIYLHHTPISIIFTFTL